MSYIHCPQGQQTSFHLPLADTLSQCIRRHVHFHLPIRQPFFGGKGTATTCVWHTSMHLSYSYAACPRIPEGTQHTQSPHRLPATPPPLPPPRKTPTPYRIPPSPLFPRAAV